MVLVMLTHHGAHGKLKLFHLEDGGFNHQRDYKFLLSTLYTFSICYFEISLLLRNIRSWFSRVYFIY
ncbi:MAG: hypothetical protein O7C58_02200 [Rickettsia endosymbiont of Ixodes persulcatus]|nr:hypothetical protein [Rickettsia endosymbiont of Ixodes persulcatus]